MPIPILIWAAAGVVGVAVARRKLRRPLNLLVLGQRAVGKTRLINSWRGDWAPPQPTQAPAKITTIRLSTGTKVLTFDRKFVFRKLSDFSGSEDAVSSYADALSRADAVLYLIDARTLVREENRRDDEPQSDDWVRVQFDAVRLNDGAPSTGRIVFVVTHTDLDPRCADTPAQLYRDRLAEQLAGPRAAISGQDRVRVVAGSLVDRESAESLTDDVIASLL